MPDLIMREDAASRPWVRILLACAAICFSTLPRAADAASPHLAKKCDRVLMHFPTIARGCEWRVYDAIAGTDARFLLLPGRPTEIAWDSSLARVRFEIGIDIFMADWSLGAKPKLVARLPDLPSICEWWFNPDSARWQFYVSLEIKPKEPVPVDRPTTSYSRTELWQSSGDGLRWHIAFADTEEWVEELCDTETPRLPRSRHLGVLTSDDLSPQMFPGDDSEQVDKAESDEIEIIPRYYVPSKSLVGRGIEAGVAQDVELNTLCKPVYLVDRRNGTRQLLCPGDGSTIEPARVSEGCGMLLIHCGESFQLIDLASGRQLHSFASGEDAMWAPRLRK
jgi:hypothetical protein